jgi:hypothetical protein
LDTLPIVRWRGTTKVGAGLAFISSFYCKEVIQSIDTHLVYQKGRTSARELQHGVGKGVEHPSYLR